MDKRQKITPLSTQHEQLLHQFKNWLVSLGYAKTTCYHLPRMIHEFLAFIKGPVTHQKAQHFMAFFKQRPNKNTGGGLSTAHINKQIGAVNTFFRFLQLHEQYKPISPLPLLKENIKTSKTILNEKQIKQLYQASTYAHMPRRDQLILDLCYGCGLRRSEAISLLTTDVLHQRRLLRISQPKNRKERLVPITEKALDNLQDYLIEERKVKMLRFNKQHPVLLISTRANPLCGESLAYRIKIMSEYCVDMPHITPHMLRHAIASHLLAKKMDIHLIAQLLGHQSLDATQIYTHINKINKK